MLSEVVKEGVELCQSAFAPLAFSTTTMLPSSSMRFSLHPDPFATSPRGRSCTYMSRRKEPASRSAQS